MGYQTGHGFKGSSSKLTSVANQEILPVAPASWTVPYRFYKFSFVCDEDCTIIVNGEEIFLGAGYLFETDEIDNAITSFKIKESGKHFSWMAAW